jgi:hypothetical protein
MEVQATGRSGRHSSYEVYSRMCKLAVAGGAVFWTANFAISLTPIAAEYRAALSISYLPMLVESLIGGLIIGFFVAYFLLRYFDKIPTRGPVQKSVLLSLIALIIATILLQGPAGLSTPDDALRYFLIGTSFNLVRILFLGVVVGLLNERLYRSAQCGPV